MANKPKEYTIYALMRPDTFTVFYIGITRSSLTQRIKQHVSDANYPHRGGVASRLTIIELIQLGLEPIVITLDRITTFSKHYAEDLERLWINHALVTGVPVQNKRGARGNGQPIHLDEIQRLHEAVNNGVTYETYRAYKNPLKIDNWGMDLDDDALQSKTA